MLTNLPYDSVIWDLDGTLADSMAMWSSLGSSYLAQNGIHAPYVDDIIDSMTVKEAAQYFADTFKIKKSAGSIMDEIEALIEEGYAHTIPAIAHSVEMLAMEYNKGKKMCILTTSTKHNADLICRRLGIDKYISDIITADELGMNKRSGDIYIETCRILGYDITRTVVVEDSEYAIKSAKEAGAIVYCIS